MKTKYIVGETTFYGIYKPKLINWKSALSQALEITGGILFFAFAFKMTSGTNIIYPMTGFALLWLVYLTNKISN